MITSPTPLPEAGNLPSIDSIKTREDINVWIDGFFNKLRGFLPDEVSNNSEYPLYTCETSLKGGVYRVTGGINGISEFDFPGEARNCLLRTFGNGVEGWFPTNKDSSSFGFRTDRSTEEDIPRIKKSLGLAEEAFNNLVQTDTGMIVWKMEDGKEIRQIFESVREATAKVLEG